jgi:membrane protein required for colicin V production
LSLLDIILSVLLLTGIVRGFIHGFIHEIAVLGTLFICYFFGFKLADLAADYLNQVIHVNPVTLHYVSIVTAWVAISVGIFFLAKLFEKLISITALGIFNKIAGAFFGGLKYAFVISLFLYFINKIDIQVSWFNSDVRAESFLYYKILKMSSWVL